MAKKSVVIADTNVWTRYLIGDVSSQKEMVLEWFAQAERGEMVVMVHPLIVAETCYVLEHFYHLSREEIAEDWQVILAQKWLTVRNRKELFGVWSSYLAGFHFVDCFLMEWSRNLKVGLLTFDRKMQKKVN